MADGTTALRAEATAPFSGERIAELAMEWRGTPYQHAASTKHYGVDSIGLIQAIWKELYGAEPGPLPAYTADWAAGRDIFEPWLARHLQPVPKHDFRPGDVLAYRMEPAAPIKHVAIVSAVEDRKARIVHAYWGRACVESWFGGYWQARHVATFRFPGVR